MIRKYQHNIPSRLAKNDFVDVFGGVYEHSAWMAEDVWEMEPDSESSRDWDTADGLHAAFRAVLDHAGDDAKHALLCAHPDLAGNQLLPTNSRRILCGAGECRSWQLHASEFDAFQTLNKAIKKNSASLSSSRSAAIIEHKF